jgi:hypothetical protein
MRRFANFGFYRFSTITHIRGSNNQPMQNPY